MATIEQLKQALVLADQAGDFENASVLAAAIKQQTEAEKAQIVPLRPGEKVPAKKEYSLMDKLLGGLEADAAIATGMTTGAVGYLSGALFGIGESVANGTFGTTQGAKLAEQTANEGMERFTYQPKTEAGQEITKDVGDMMTNLMAFGPHPEMMTGDVGGAVSAATPYLKAKAGQTAQGVKNASQPIVKVTKPIIEKVFKKELPTKPDEVAATIYKASKGDEEAKKIIQEIAPLDEEALKAAERLEIDHLPLDYYLQDDNVAKTVGLSRSQVGSAEEMAFKHDIINTSQVAEEALNQFGKVTSIAEVSDDVKNALQAARNKLKEQEKILYQSFDETLPPEQRIVADNLLDLLNKTADELGGEARLTATEKNLLALSKAENLTYGALLRAKNDIGSAVGGQKTLFPDVNDFQLKKIYDAIREDQKAAVSLFGGEDQLSNLKLANILTVKRKAIENNIIQGYGRKGEGSIAGLINRAITAGSKGDVAPLDKLLSVVPVEMHKDVVATALKDLSISKKAVNLGEFDFANYAKTYEGLRKNAPVYSKIINILGTDKAQMLQDLYTISKKIVEAKSNVLHTGKANQAIIAGLKGNTIMQNIVGKIIGWGTSKISAGLISPDFMFKTPQDKLQAIADLMRNPDFKQMMIEASKGKASTETINKVMATDAYKRASAGESTEPIIVEEVKPTTKEEVKAKVEAKKQESTKPKTEQQEARDLHKEVKSNPYLETYKDLILDEGKAKTKGERNQSHFWNEAPVTDAFGQQVATMRGKGARDVTEAFTADSAAINRFMNGKATVEDLKAINHDLRTFEMSSDLRDEAAINKANKTNESVELSDGSIYDPFSKMSYTKEDWKAMQDEAMFSQKKSEVETSNKDNITESVKDLKTRLEGKEQKIEGLIRSYAYGKAKKPSIVYRGVASKDNIINQSSGAASEGFGLYTTLNKDLAKDYGEVMALDGKEATPNNPLAFTDYNQYEIFMQQLMYNVAGYKRASDFGALNPNEILHIINPNIDGIQIGKGNKTFWVKFPDINEVRTKQNYDVMFSKANERLTEWHKDSAPETKNADGSPKVFYHGTKANFDTFDIEKSNVGNYGTGFYFGENAETISKHFADKPSSNIMPAYLKADNLFDATKINKPLVEDYLKSINAEGFTPNYEIRPFLFYKSIMSLKGTESFKKFIQSKGYDGIIGQTPAVGKQIVVFSPEQIKSIHNKGAFSESNPNILMSQFKTKNSTTKQEAQTIAQSLLGEHYAKHSDTFEIVQSIEELPQNIKDALYSVEAYHGTPHNVDKFSTKYIGTGEGAQAYGYGMYFADSKEVAEFYKNSLTPKDGVRIDGKNVSIFDLTPSELSAAREIKSKGYEEAEYWAQRMVDKPVQKGFEHLAEKYKKELDAIRSFKGKKVEELKGNLYKVELKPKEDEYLHWDKPLSEQSDYVKEKLKGKEWLFKQYQDFLQDNKRQGADIYYGFESITDWKNAEKAGLSRKEWRDIETSQQGASNYLHSLGIKGIKYLDNTSRGKGKGNYNYVIFKDEDVGKPEILKSGGKARGIFDPKSGKAYIIADAMKANEVEGVILHELLHKNINNEVKAGKSRAEAIMGSRYESVVKRLDNLYKMGDKQVKEAFQKVTDANTPAQHRIEEVMTYLLENITNESKPLLIKWKDDVLAAIKAFIAKVSLQLGMKAETVMNKLDSKDIANILRSEAIKNESMLKNIKR